ncbi:MAG: hypothetical protein ACI3YT_11265 [Prevotella sp.]
MEKRKLDKIEKYICYISVIVYILCRHLELPRTIEYIALAIWGQCMVYELKKWKENKKSDNYYNLFVLVIVLAVLLLGL